MSFKSFLGKLSSAARKLSDPVATAEGPAAPMSKMMSKINHMMPAYTLTEVLNFEHLNRGGPIRDIFLFREENHIRPWRLVTDEVVGGKSTARIEFDAETNVKSGDRDEVVIRASKRFSDSPTRYSGLGSTAESDARLSDFILNEEERQALSAANEAETSSKTSKSTIASNEPITRQVGSLKFSGVLNLDLPNPRVERSGFAAMLSPAFERRLNIEHYDGIEMRIRTDGRIYVAQIKTDTNMEDDLYQAIIPAVKPNTWTRVIIPLSEFMLTFRGYAEEDQIPLDAARIVHIGILMAERNDGPFRFNVDWIRAVRIDEVPYDGIRRLARALAADEI